MSDARRLVISRRAELDLREIAAFIRRDNPRRADTFIAEPEGPCRAIAIGPRLHVRRGNLGQGLRMALHGRYIILYRDFLETGVLRIERIVHGSRDLQHLMKKR